MSSPIGLTRSKSMTLQGVLPADAAARSLFASYPPALPLWQYLAQTVNGLLAAV